MPRPPIALFVLLLALSAGRRAVAEGEWVAGELEDGGRTRTYHLLLPPGHEKSVPAPLVLALHGGGGNGRQFAEAAGGAFGREAARRGWVVAFPDGLEKGWNDGRPLNGLRERRRAGVDDVAFLSALIDRLRADLGIDLARVYATGISNGGFMSFRLGVDLAERIAAIAPVAAQMTPQLAEKTPARRVPLMLVNGTADPLVPYDGGHVRVLGTDRGAVLSTDATLRWWTERNACAGEVGETLLPDTAPDDGTRVRVLRRTACADGAEVVLYRIEGGGHTWPGGAEKLPRILVGRTSRDIDATHEIFEFFARHALPAAPGPPTADR